MEEKEFLDKFYNETSRIFNVKQHAAEVLGDDWVQFTLSLDRVFDSKYFRFICGSYNGQKAEVLDSYGKLSDAILEFEEAICKADPDGKTAEYVRQKDNSNQGEENAN